MPETIAQINGALAVNGTGCRVDECNEYWMLFTNKSGQQVYIARETSTLAILAAMTGNNPQSAPPVVMADPKTGGLCSGGFGEYVKAGAGMTLGSMVMSTAIHGLLGLFSGGSDS
jgi:hypothetical protein